MRIETNNNMGAGARPCRSLGAAGECRVAIEPMTLHKRGRLNNQSSDTLDAVVGHPWTFLQDSECLSRSSALFVLHQHRFFEPNGERHHGQEGKATRVDQERREGTKDDGAQQDPGAEDCACAQADGRRHPPKGSRLGRFAEFARVVNGAPAAPPVPDTRQSDPSLSGK